MIAVSSAYDTENDKYSRTPVYKIVFDGIPQTYSTHPLGSCHAYMELPRGNAAMVRPEKGQSSLGSINIVLNDINGEITTLVMGVIDGKTATLYMGFAGIGESDYVAVFVGIVDSIRLTSDLTGYEVSIREPATLTNRNVFNVASSKLLVDMASGDTSLTLTDADDYLSSGYIRIDDELISYAGETVGVAPGNITYRAVAFGAGLFVAVCSAGTANRVSTSSDGSAWTLRTSAEDNTWRGITYSAELSLFAAVASDGTHRVMTSPDGITWTARTAASASTWTAVAWSAALGLFCAVGTNAVMTSPDGINWTSRTAAAAWTWVAVCWSPEQTLFVAVADDSVTTTPVMTSPDGVTWTSQTTTNNQRWSGVAWAPTLGLFAIIANGVSGVVRASTSPDGVTWTNRVLPAAASALTWARGRFIGVGSSTAVTSDDGITWTSRSIGAFTWLGIAGSVNQVVAVGSSAIPNQITSSPDGITWTIAKSTFTGLTRGVLNTVAAAHTAGVAVQEILRLGPSHPIDIASGVLQNTDKTGLGIAAALIDTAGLASLKTAIGSSYQMEFLVDSAANAMTWLEQNLYQAAGLYPITSNGLYSIHRASLPASAVDSISHDSIVAENGRPALEYDGNFRGSLINYIKFDYDYDLIKNAFLSTVVFQDGRSVALYGQSPISISSKGFHSSLSGTDDFISSVAALILARCRNGTPLIKARVFLQKNLLEPGDVVSVTSSLLPNPSSGARGLTAALMEILSREMVFDRGYVELLMTWANWRPDLPADSWLPQTDDTFGDEVFQDSGDVFRPMQFV